MKTAVSITGSGIFLIIDDSHIHTYFSPDAPRDSFPEEQIKRAIALGLKSMCFTDHYDEGLVGYTKDSVGPNKGNIPYIPDIDKYFEELMPLKEKYRDQIDIGIGMEFGMSSSGAKVYEEAAEKYPFDFLINSTHFFSGIDPCHDNHGLSDKALYKIAIIDGKIVNA